MPSKTEEYLALAQRTANGLTRYWESWTDYLTTASRLYKYSFADQLMIYAQRPDATACADFDIWNNRMNRYVRWTFREKWQRAKAAEDQGVGCGVLRAADPKESRLPGLPQGTERNARTGSGTEKCRTFFCRGKEHHRENTDTLKKVAEELSLLGGILGGFFIL